MDPSHFANVGASSSRDVVRWLLHLGGIGLIPLGILDSSLIPLPGSMDVATVLLAARDKQLWFYYAAMATVGSLLGGFLTYRLARKGGKAALQKKFPRKDIRKVQKTFERWGFAAIFVPALLPPPLPLVPFLVAAGSMQYPLTKFLIALASGRVARYFVLAFLGAHYGRQILSLFSRHTAEILYAGLGVAVVTVLIVLLLHFKHRARKPA
jgi:membrane protein YqaA with SNARE-associated domain